MVVTREAKTLQWSDIGRRITRVEHGKKITVRREGRAPLLLEPDTKINVRGALSRGN